MQYDFTGCGIYLFVIGMVLMIFGIIAIFMRNNIMDTVYAAGIALLFSMVSLAIEEAGFSFVINVFP